MSKCIACDFHYRIEADVEPLLEMDCETRSDIGDLLEQAVLVVPEAETAEHVIFSEPVDDGMYLVLKSGIGIACVVRRNDGRTVLLHITVFNSKNGIDSARREGLLRFAGYKWPDRGTLYAT